MKTILITGASSGMGKATAKLFSEKGWNVIATMRKPEKETELNTMDNVLVTRLDVTDLSSIQKAVEEGLDKFGQIDVLLNNAGYGGSGVLEAFSREDMIRQIDTNFVGVLDTMRAVLPHFRSRKEGVIINVTSVGGRVTFPTNSVYHGAKFAVEGVTESMYHELKEIGVQAKIVEPGSIASDFLKNSEFYNDETMVEYQPMIQKISKGFENLSEIMETFAPASAVAEVVYEAATDGKNQLRYYAGNDAESFIKAKFDNTDEVYLENIAKAHGL